MLCYRCGEENRFKEQFCIKCGSVLSHHRVNGPGGSHSTGLPQTTAALLSYLGWWVTGLIFYLLESNRFVRFHALQSVMTFGSISVLLVALSAIRRAPLVLVRTGSARFSAWLSLLGALTPLIWIGAFLLWAVLIVKAAQGEIFKLPVAGDLAEKQLQ